MPGYSPSTVNWYDAYHVVRDDIVVDIWPIIPRGPQLVFEQTGSGH